MKAYFISFLLHASLLGFVLIYGPTPEDHQDHQIIVEIIAPNSPPPSQLSHSNRQTSKQKTRAHRATKKIKDVIPSTNRTPPNIQQASINNKALSQADEFLVSQKGQKIRMSYIEQLRTYIEQNKFYPRSARRLKHAGIVKIRVVIGENGEFESVNIHQGCQHETLNRAATKLIRDLKRFKPLPHELVDNNSFTLPITYRIVGGS